MITEKEAGMMYIEDEDIELARKILEQWVKINSQEALCPEEFDDGQDDTGPTVVEQGKDYERMLNELVDTQERMDNGMAMIEESNRKIEGFFRANAYMPAIYNAWKWNRGAKYDHSYLYNVATGRIPCKENGDHMYHPKENQYCTFLTNKLNEARIAWLNRRARLWDHWNMLKDKCADIVGTNTYLWVQYFELPEEDLTLYWTTADSEDIDNLVVLHAGQDQTIDCLFDTHMEEERNYDRHIQVEWTDHTGGFIPKCKDVTYLYRDDLSEIDQMILDAPQSPSSQEDTIPTLPKGMGEQMTNEEFASQEAPF